MSDLSILIKALLDPDSTKNIESQIKNLQTLFDKSPLKVKLDVDNAEFKAFSSNLQKLSTELNKSLNINSNTGGLDKYSEKFVMITGQAQKQVEYTKEFTNNLGQSVKEINKLDEEGKEVVKVLTTITDNYEKQRKEQEKLVEAMARGREKAEANRKALDRRVELQQSEAINRAKDKEYELSKKIAQQQKQQLADLNAYKLKMLGDGKGILGELDIFSTKQKGRFDKTALDNIRKQVDALNINTPDLQNKIRKLGIEFSSLKQQAAQSGNAMTRALENAYKFLRFYLVGGLLVRVVNAFRDSINTVTELDTSLTELNKVADLTNVQLEKITDKAYELGKVIGRTGKEVIDATAEFKRAGFDIEDSLNLSNQALLLTNIGDGIDDVKEASSSLIAVLKGFKLEAESTSHVVDSLNEVSNNYAVDTVNLTEILKRTSGTIAQTGTSFEELIGLATGGFESLRNAEMVASGINMISQRLRGMSEDGEAVEGLLPKIQKAFDKYTKGTVSIIDKQNGGLHSTYEILQQLSKIYPKLDDSAKAYLNEAIAGNRQNKVLVAIMENWHNVEDAVISATNSTGSALKENEKYLDSIKGKVSQFTSATQKMWKNTISSDFIKSIIDFGTTLVNVVDSGFVRFIGTTALLTAGIYGLGIGIKALGKTTVGTALGVAALDLAQKGLLATTKALWATLSASPLFWITAAVVGIQGLVSAFNALNVSIEKQKEKVEKAKQAYTETKNELETLNAELDKTKIYIDELNSKDTLSIVEENELQKLQLSNEELEMRIDLLEREAELNQKILADEQIRLYEKQYGKYEFSDEAIRENLTERPNELWIANIKDEKDNVSALIAAYQRVTELRQNALAEGDTETYDHYKTLLEEIEGYLINASKELIGIKDTLSLLDEPTENQKNTLFTIENMLDHIYGLISSNSDKPVIPSGGNGTEEVVEQLEQVNESLDEASKKTDKYNSNIKSLSSTYRTLADGQKLTADQLLELISLYPDYASEITKINDNQENAINLTQTLFSLEKERYIQALNQEQKLLESKINLLEADMAIGEWYTYYYSLGKSGGSEEYRLAQDQVKVIRAQVEYLRGLTIDDFNKSSTSTSGKYDQITEFSALKELYDKQVISGEYYIQRLLELERTQYSDYTNKSADQLESLLRSSSKEVAERTKDYLSLKDAIQGAKDQLKKNMESLQSEAEKALKDYLEIERKLKEQTAQSTYEKKLSSAEKKIYGESQKAFEEASNARIEAYENEIKRLQEKSDLIQEQIDREKRLADIEKQKNIIANLQQQKTVRVYRDGQWVYEADQQKLIEARERLETMQQDYYEWENNLRRQRQIQALQDSIQFERQQQEEKRKSMERQKEILDAELKNEQLAIEQHYIDMDTLVSEGMDGLKDTYEEKWDEILEVLKDRLERAKSIQRQIELANLRAQQAALQIETTTTTKVTNQLVRDSGGKVPSGTSAINLSGKDETMLSPAATKAWIKLVDNLTDISRVFDVRSFRFPNFTPAMAGGGGTTQTYNIHVDRIETEDAQSFIDLLPTIVKQYK